MCRFGDGFRRVGLRVLRRTTYELTPPLAAAVSLAAAVIKVCRSVFGNLDQQGRRSNYSTGDEIAWAAHTAAAAHAIS
jgi:hypothetical protein